MKGVVIKYEPPAKTEVTNDYYIVFDPVKQDGGKSFLSVFDKKGILVSTSEVSST